MGPRFSAMLLGLAQLLAALAMATLWRVGHPVIVEHGGADYGLAQLMIHGFAHYLYFLFATPWGWLADWLFIEGLLRIVAGVMGQPLGSAPRWLYRGLRAALHRPPPPLPDLLLRQGDRVIIESAHAYDWHALTTVELDGALYAVSSEPGRAPRPHRYHLSPIAPDHVVRALSRYPAARSAARRP